MGAGNEGNEGNEGYLPDLGSPVPSKSHIRVRVRFRVSH